MPFECSKCHGTRSVEHREPDESLYRQCTSCGNRQAVEAAKKEQPKNG